MSYKKIEDLLVWQKPKERAVETDRLFSKSKDFSFRDQIQRAAISATNNIAESYGRDGDKEFRRFLFMAKSSRGDVRSMPNTAKNPGYISKETFTEKVALTGKIPKMITGLIKKL